MLSPAVSLAPPRGSSCLATHPQPPGCSGQPGARLCPCCFQTQPRLHNSARAAHPHTDTCAHTRPAQTHLAHADTHADTHTLHMQTPCTHTDTHLAHRHTHLAHRHPTHTHTPAHCHTGPTHWQAGTCTPQAQAQSQAHAHTDTCTCAHEHMDALRSPAGREPQPCPVRGALQTSSPAPPGLPAGLRLSFCLCMETLPWPSPPGLTWTLQGHIPRPRFRAPASLCHCSLVGPSHVLGGSCPRGESASCPGFRWRPWVTQHPPVREAGSRPHPGRGGSVKVCPEGSGWPWLPLC